jgi:hypothetical protein
MGKDKNIMFGFLKIIILAVIFLGLNIQKVICATPIISSFEITYHGGTLLNSGSNNNYVYRVNEKPYMRVKINSNCTDRVILLIAGETFSNSGLDLCYSSDNIVPKNAIINIDIPIPNYVARYHFTWQWSITAIPSCNTSNTYESNTVTQTTSQLFYVILDNPKEPMVSTSNRWPRVLELACAWAHGSTNQDQAATKITEALYYSSGLNYQSYSHFYKDHLFNLGDFLDKFGTRDVNCQDMAAAVTIFANSIGCNMVFKVILRLNEKHILNLNSIDPIGSAPPTNNEGETDLFANDCRTGGFSFHAVAQDINNNTWDATLRYNIGVNPDNVSNSGGVNGNCGTVSTGGFEWSLPCNVPEAVYLKRLIDDWTKTQNCINPYNCVRIEPRYLQLF